MATDSTELAARRIRSVAAANDEFGRSVNLLLARPGRNLVCRMWLTVPEGFYCLVACHGADVDYVGPNNQAMATWPPGKHTVSPWTQVSAMVTKQSVVFDTPVKGCRTRDNVAVEIDVAIILRIMGDPEKGEDPELVRTFVHQLGPVGLQQQLNDAQEEAVRGLARSVGHEAVYGLRSNPSRSRNVVPEGEYKDDDAGATDATRQLAEGVTDDMKRSLNDQFNRLGVQITDVIIEDVRLPAAFVRQMSDKTVMLATIKEQRWRQKSDMQVLEMKEEIATLEQSTNEERLRVAQEEEAACLEVEMRLNNMRAETAASKADIDTTSYANVSSLNETALGEVTRLREEKAQLVSNMTAQATAEAAAVHAEAEKYVEEKLAEAALTVKTNEARAFQIKAEAEGQAATMLNAKRQFEEDQQRMEIFGALTDNPDLILSADNSANINNLLLCDRILSKRADVTHHGANKSQILAEMLVTQRQSEVMAALRTGSE